MNRSNPTGLNVVTYLIGGPRAHLALRKVGGDVLCPALLALAIGEVGGEGFIELGANQAPILFVFTCGSFKLLILLSEN